MSRFAVKEADSRGSSPRRPSPSSTHFRRPCPVHGGGLDRAGYERNQFLLVLGSLGCNPRSSLRVPSFCRSCVSSTSFCGPQSAMRSNMNCAMPSNAFTCSSDIWSGAFSSFMASLRPRVCMTPAPTYGTTADLYARGNSVTTSIAVSRSILRSCARPMSVCSVKVPASSP
jgi:hypothetical protein